MIGQIHLQETIQSQISTNRFPQFSIITGPKGSGKKMLAHEVSAMFGSDTFIQVGISINDIRDMIKESYKINGLKIVYLIADADDMSVPAKNALLKITEEPPKNAYFIMTLEDINNTLETVKSRATVFKMEPYTPNDIKEYSSQKYSVSQDDLKLLADICETPGEVDMIENFGLEDFYNYVVLTVDHIQTASLANALKIANRISMKVEDTENYDLKLFWKAFIKVCASRMLKESEYSEWIRITSKMSNKLRIRGVNKQMLFDNWVFSIREWR